MKEKARGLIAKSNIQPVIALLLEATKGKESENELLQFSGQWNKLKKEERMGLLSSEEANRRNNLIVKGLLEVVSEL